MCMITEARKSLKMIATLNEPFNHVYLNPTFMFGWPLNVGKVE